MLTMQRFQHAPGTYIVVIASTAWISLVSVDTRSANMLRYSAGGIAPTFSLQAQSMYD